MKNSKLLKAFVFACSVVLLAMDVLAEGPSASTSARPTDYTSDDGEGAVIGDVFTPPEKNKVSKPNAGVWTPGSSGNNPAGGAPLGPIPPPDPFGGVGFDGGPNGHDGIDGKPGGASGGGDNGGGAGGFPPDDSGTPADAEESTGGGGGAGAPDEDTGGDPVGYTSGASSTSAIDIIVECPDIDLVFQRVYNSSLTTSSGLGYGWTHSYDWELRPYNSGKWMVLRAMADPSQGNRCATYHNFERFADGTYSVSDADQYILTKNTDGSYDVRTPGSLTYHFGADGVMETISHISGNAVTLTYMWRGDPLFEPMLVRVEHSNGKALVFSYSATPPGLGEALIESIQTPLAEFHVDYTFTNVVNQTLASATRVLGDQTSEMTYKYARKVSGKSSTIQPFRLMVSVNGSVGSCLSNPNIPYVTPVLYSNKYAGLMTEKTDANGITAFFDHVKYTDAAGVRVGYTVLDGGLYETTLKYYTGKTIEMRSVAGKNVKSVYLYDNPTKKEYARRTGSTVTRRRFNAYGDVAGVIVSDTNTLAYTYSAMNYGTWHNVTNFAFAYCEEPTNFWTQTWSLEWMLPQTTISPEGRVSQWEIDDYRIAVHGAGTNSPLDKTVSFCDTNWRVNTIVNANQHQTSFFYNDLGYLSRLAPQGQPEVAFEYNALGFKAKTEMPGPDGTTRSTLFQNNAFGRPTRIVYPDGTEASMKYDGNWKRVVESVDALGRTNVYDWVLGVPVLAKRFSEDHPTGMTMYAIVHDQQMNTLSITDPLGRPSESYVLDKNERIVAVTNLEGQVMTRNFIVGDHVNHVTRYDGSPVHWWYAENGKPLVVKYPDDQIWYAYDRDGLMLSASNSTGVVSNAYNEASWLSSTWGVDGSEIAYTYHPAGQVAAVTTIAGTTDYAVDPADRLAQITAPASSFSYGYNSWNGRVSAVTNSNGLTAEYAYDIMSRPTNIVWRKSNGLTLAGFGYGYNAVGMITDRTTALGTNAVAIAYGYDGLDRLVSESESSGVSRTYAYDLVGNRLSKTETGSGPIAYSLGLGDRLATYTGGSYAYDTAGCVTAIDRTGKPDLDLTWNGQYQLTSVSTNGVVAESYTYDPLGRRFSTTSGGTTLRHVYDGIHCVADIDSVGSVVKSYTWGPGVDNLLAVTCHSGTLATTYYALTDLQGTVHGFADAGGNLVAQYTYDAWGTLLDVDVAVSELADNRYLFQGREYSWATGLTNFRLRWYDPATGRWISKDPIGISGGLNLYAFCGDDPVNNRDPWGLCKEAEEKLAKIRNYLDHTGTGGSDEPTMLVAALASGIGAAVYHGGPWSPLDTKYHNPRETINVPGRGSMRSDEFGNYLAGYYAGYSPVRGIYYGMRSAGFGYAAVGAVAVPIMNKIGISTSPPERWTDADSVPAINDGYNDGVRDRKLRRK